MAQSGSEFGDFKQTQGSLIGTFIYQHIQQKHLLVICANYVTSASNHVISGINSCNQYIKVHMCIVHIYINFMSFFLHLLYCYNKYVKL